MAKLPGIYELMATAASPAINFGRGLLGYQDPFTTQTMRDRMAELEAEKGPTGNVGYEDYGLQTATPGGRFTGGLMGLALNDPVNFGLAGSIGRYSYSPQGRTGLTYDFTPDQDTGSTGSATLDFINRGGLKGAISRMGTAQAAEVTPQKEGVTPGANAIFGPGAQLLDYDDLRNREGMPIDRPDPANAIFGPGAQLLDYDEQVSPGTIRSGIENYNQPTTVMNEPLDIEDFLGTSTPQDLGFIGNAPSIQEAVAPVGITDRGRGMPGEMGAYEMIGGTPVAVGDVLGRQQALEKADFYEEPTRGIDLGMLGLLAGPAGFLTGSNALRGIGLAANIASGRAGRAVDAVSRGLGSLGTKVSGKMRGINPATGKANTQAQYEANRTARQQQNRTDRMIDRIAAGKKTRSNPRDAGTTKAQKDAISAAIQDSYRGGGGGGGSSGGGKIVCTMMNERYGFGSFRNKIWMKFHEHHGPEYQKGYHAIFLPLVKIAKGEGKINTAVRKVLEHMGRHVTADMFKIMKGKKRDTLGRIYRAIFEPTCHIVGKIKSAFGRG